MLRPFLNKAGIHSYPDFYVPVLYFPSIDGITLFCFRLMKKISMSLYWKCQLVGWIIAGLYWAFGPPLEAGFNWLQAGLDFAGDLVICILLTHSYRNLVLRLNWHTLSLRSLIPRIIPAIFLLGTAFMLVITLKLYIVRVYAVKGFTLSLAEFFVFSRQTLFITGIRLMSIWVLAYHLYHYAQREINTARENARLSVIAKEAQLNNLSSQLNPHFFFNSLNNIKFLVLENPSSARRAIDLLCDLLRNSLYNKTDKLIPLKDEMNLVNDYLELEKLRFEERLQTKILIDPLLSGLLIPPLSVQCVVENAVKHGISKKKEGGLIEIEIKRESDFLKIAVQNPGTLNSQDKAGLGIKNLTERLLLQYNGKASFAIEAIAAEKVLTTISIPVNE